MRGHAGDPQVWYVVIADCSLEQIYHEIPPIKYDVTLLNGKHHIPAEQHGLATTYSVLTVLLVLAGIVGHFLIRDQRQALGELHLIVKLLLLAYMLNLVACLFESIHLWLYGLAGAAIYALQSHWLEMPYIKRVYMASNVCVRLMGGWV